MWNHAELRKHEYRLIRKSISKKKKERVSEKTLIPKKERVSDKKHEKSTALQSNKVL